MRIDAGKLRSAALLTLIAAAALWLRIAALDQESAWCDEALSAACLPASSLSDCLECAFDRDPVIRVAPLYHVVQYGWSRIAGAELFHLRILSVALSMLALAQLYLFARSLGGVSAARWALALQSLSLSQIYYAQEVRVYALVNVLALFSMHAFWIHWRSGRMPWLWCAVAANALLLMTHSFGILLILPQTTLLLFRQPMMRPLLHWTLAHVGVGALYLIWLSLIGYNPASESLAMADRLAGIREVVAAASQFTGGRFTNVNPGDYLALGWNVELPILFLSAILLALGSVAALRGANNEGKVLRPTIGMLAIWFVLPVLALYIAGQVWRPCFYTRYVIYCAAPLAILLGISLASGPTSLLRRGLGALLIALLLWQNLALPRPFRADYQALSRIVAKSNEAHPVVLALKPFNYLAAAYALRDTEIPVEELYGLKETIGVTRNRIAEGRSVWVVFYKWDALERFESAIEEAGLVFQKVVTAGMPPAQIYQVRPGPQ